MTRERRPCPCGSALPYPGCCGLLHDGTATAATAAEVRRSRSSAFARRDVGYLGYPHLAPVGPAGAR